MPPRMMFKKEDVLKIAYEIVEKEGFNGLNARRIAEELHSSVHPIFKHFQDMEELKKAVYEKIGKFTKSEIMELIRLVEQILAENRKGGGTLHGRT